MFTVEWTNTNTGEQGNTIPADYCECDMLCKYINSACVGFYCVVKMV